jgi:probable blue pigment (indigoidine) exporter
MNKPVPTVFVGLLFSIFWASASVAGKFGLFSVEPLVLFNTRFLGAGIILLLYVYLIQKSRAPQGLEWKHLTIFGAFNTTLYLGLFAIALQYITPGITTLAVALNPLFISVLSALWMKRKVVFREWLSILLGIGGIVVASLPLLKTSYATPEGLILLAFSMIGYSIGAVYYSAIQWKISRTTVNAWQVFIGGLLLIPFTWWMHETENHFDTRFWLSLGWLIIPVSIGAVELWLKLLKTDPVRASLWLYLCPVFGFLYAYLLLDEPITGYTFAGTALVMTALYLGQQAGSSKVKVFETSTEKARPDA